MILTNLCPKISKNYICKECKYECSKKSLFDKHLLTRKHEIRTNPNEKISINKIYICECGKEYKHNSSLCNHKKKCYYKSSENNDQSDYKTMFIKMMGENEKLQNLLIEQQKQMSNLIPQIGNNNNNITNKVKNKFNINVFLNEKCKDAISIDQFIDQIDISMKNLLTTKDKGLGQGLSSIIIDNMNKLSLYERPMHCTDKKRETLYVKNNEWEKDEKKEQIGKLLNRVEEKQMKSINKWIKEHPNWENNSSEQEEYMKLVRNCTDDIKEDKIIKCLCNNNYLNPDDAFE